MFTGIIETIGTIEEVISSGTNLTFWITSPISAEFSIDQSVSHNGVCLTVEEIKNGQHKVTAIDETLVKTDLKSWKKGMAVNIERCLQMNGRLDGHIVQGHVDSTATDMLTQQLLVHKRSLRKEAGNILLILMQNLQHL